MDDPNNELAAKVEDLIALATAHEKLLSALFVTLVAHLKIDVLESFEEQIAAHKAQKGETTDPITARSFVHLENFVTQIHKAMQIQPPEK